MTTITFLSDSAAEAEEIGAALATAAREVADGGHPGFIRTQIVERTDEPAPPKPAASWRDVN